MIENIEDLIEVKRPYYSLTDFKCDANGVSAMVASEQPMECEAGGIAAAEVGRHLAILGSCALAASNPDRTKHYYLAHKASLKRRAFAHDNDAGHYKIDARTTYLDKRKGVAHSKLFLGQRHLFDLEVAYHVMKEKIFHKLYKERTLEYDFGSVSPYSGDYPIVDLNFAGNRLTAMLAPLAPQQCSGHFEKHPCLPVAVLMHALSRSAGRLLGKQFGGDTAYVVESADIVADNLAFYDDPIHIEIQFREEAEGKYFYRCEAGDGDRKSFGKMDLALATVAF